MIERELDIATRHGRMFTHACHPERNGPHPAIVLYMDAFGIREELRDMARRLATVGYFVAMPNLFYRSGVLEVGPIPADPEAPERARMMKLVEELTIGMVMDDTEALLGWLDGESAAARGPAGCMGYCMSGQYAVNAAARFPRFAAAASIYGTMLMTEQPDSPHRVAAKARAELYFACAGNDVWFPADRIPVLREALKAAGALAEVEAYPGAGHGFAFPARATYDKACAERHWERLFSLFARRLGAGASPRPRAPH